MPNKPFSLITSIILFFLLSNALGQATTYIDTAPTNFITHITDIHADTLGIIEFECQYKENGNQAGNAKGYLIHKQGGRWWYEQAKKNATNGDVSTPRRRFYAVENATENLLEADTTVFNEYDKWVFFVDKQYLKPYNIPSVGDDPGYITYKLKPNIVYEEILYEQKAGSHIWTILEKKKFKLKTDENGNTTTIDPTTGKTIVDNVYSFSIKEKLNKGNEQKQ